MSDVGLFVSMPGEDVVTTKDGLLLQSDVPTIKVLAHGVTAQGGSDGWTTVYTHNLGYYPAFVCFSWDATSGSIISTVGRCDKTVFQISKYAASSKYISWFVFDTPLERPAFYPSDINIFSDNYSQSPDIGIKVALPGKDINSQDMRDFVIHSSLTNALIHQVEPGALVVPSYTGFEGISLSSTHNLGYVPRGWLYVRGEGAEVTKFAGGYYYHATTGTEGGNLYFNTTVIGFYDSYYNAGTYHYSFITFKNRIS